VSALPDTSHRESCGAILAAFDFLIGSLLRVTAVMTPHAAIDGAHARGGGRTFDGAFSGCGGEFHCFTR
jgi:hypothetical protein